MFRAPWFTVSSLSLVNMGNQYIIKMMYLKAEAPERSLLPMDISFLHLLGTSSQGPTLNSLYSPQNKTEYSSHFSVPNMWNMRTVLTIPPSHLFQPVSPKLLSIQPLKHLLVPSLFLIPISTPWKSLSLFYQMMTITHKWFPAFRMFPHQCSFLPSLLLPCWKLFNMSPLFMGWLMPTSLRLSPKSFPKLAPPLPLPPLSHPI